MSYNFEELLIAFRKVGIKKGDNILVKGDLRYLGKFTDNQKIAQSHFEALSSIIDLKKAQLLFLQRRSLCAILIFHSI